MDNRQSSTTINELTPYEKLDLIYKQAIDMRLEFFKYKYIAVQLKVEEQTVRSWFQINGKCHEAYHWKKGIRELESESMISEAKKKLGEMIPEAINVINKKLLSNNLDAAIKVLGINGIAAIEKLEVDDKNGNKIDKIAQLLETMKHDKSGNNKENENTS